jgi:ABC-type branched-subunit amino acid transport system substrate-binding protein
LLTVKTGPLASGGIDMERALVMYLNERKNELGGRKVELLSTDTGGVPATARTKTQELIEKDNVNCIVGPLAAFEALAIDDYLRAREMPTLSVAAAERRHDAAQSEPVVRARHVHIGAMRASSWRIRREGTEVQAHDHDRGRYRVRA